LALPLAASDIVIPLEQEKKNKAVMMKMRISVPFFMLLSLMFKKGKNFNDRVILKLI
jgi:hypothetical protein